MKSSSAKPPTKRADLFFNRELSWLEFNQRVLDEAANNSLPLLERLKFLAITASNLDEFCMVRVGGLKLLVEQRIRSTDIAGMTPLQQLRAVARRMRLMAAEQDRLCREIGVELAERGLVIQEDIASLTPEQRKWLHADFLDNIFPLLSVIGCDTRRPFRPAGLRMHCAVLIAPPLGTPEAGARLALIPLGPGIPRFIRVSASGGTAIFVPVEKVVAWQIGTILAGQTVRECVAFRITRNADIELREDLSDDLLAGMQELLDDRRATACIRAEIRSPASRDMIRTLTEYLGIGSQDVYAVDGLLELRALFSLVETEGFDHLLSEPWEPVASPDVDIRAPLLPQIAERDILLIHPYESFDPVVKFIDEAASDPQVQAIKQVLYRTAPGSEIVEALIRAAQAGKHVTVLIELKARFDEARNITQAQRLELAGCHVIHGVRNLKTHAKICLVMRREKRGLARYCHFGTGNYNEKTARQYSDVGFFTCHPDFGADASDVFNAITGYSQPQSLRRLEVAPFTIRTTLLKLIANEVELVRGGGKGQITLKMNSLSDEILIRALYEASQAGVRVRLNVRGICCLRPGVPGLSENITVVGIVDRFLEHARIFCFHDDGRKRLYISSADGMPRNLDKRIELMVPVIDAASRHKLLQALEAYFADNRQARILRPDGSYQHPVPHAKEPAYKCQKQLYTMARDAARLKERTKPTMLQPYKNRKRARDN